MASVTTKSELLQGTTTISSRLFDDWFDPIETGIRHRVRGLIEEMINAELHAVLSRHAMIGAQAKRKAATPRLLWAIGMEAVCAR